MQLTVKQLRDALTNISDETLVTITIIDYNEETNVSTIVNAEFDNLIFEDNVIKKYVNGKFHSQENKSKANIRVTYKNETNNTTVNS